MSYAVSRSAVDAFYQAYDSRKLELIEAVLDDDVSWQVVGPKGIVQICGHWHGKAAVIDWFTRVVPQFVEFIRLDRTSQLVDGDRSALLGQVFCRHRESDRMICFKVAHFVRYHDGKVISFCVINDSLDAAEQFIGHHIQLTDETDSDKSDLIAV